MSIITIPIHYTHELKIECPLFFRSILKDEHLAIFGDDNVVSTYEGPTFNTVEHGTVEVFKHRIERAYNNWDKITEEEFMEYYEHYLTTLSFKPQLVEVQAVHPGYEIIKNSIK